MAAALLMAILGRLKVEKEEVVFSSFSANLAAVRNDPVVNRVNFRLDGEGVLAVEIEAQEGEVGVAVAEVPPVVEFEGVTVSARTLFSTPTSVGARLRAPVKSGAFALVLTNSLARVARVKGRVTLTSSTIRFPRLYEVGIQVLVVAVPLIISSFFT